MLLRGKALACQDFLNACFFLRRTLTTQGVNQIYFR